ncbi:MAG: hypothetical protein ACREFQ_04160 [Stellaceae bacterium]
MKLFLVSFLIGLSLAVSACKDPDKREAVGNKYYRTLPAGKDTSWPSSGTSNGRGCVPASGQHLYC